MTDRDRLINSARPFANSCACKEETGVCEFTDCKTCNATCLADVLIEDGWIRPPCKVGDIIWVYDFMWGLIPCKVDKPYHCVCGENGSCTFRMSFTDGDIGKTVFLTREEAERKLKELGK